MEVMGIVGLDGGFILGPAAVDIAKNMCGVMIDDYDHATRLWAYDRRRFRGGSLEKSTQPRNLIGTQLGCVGLLEEFPVSADDKSELAAAGRLHRAQMLDELECVVPMQAPRQFAMQQ